MPRTLTLQSSDYNGLVCVAEPKARRTIAAKYKLPSGAIPVLISAASMAVLRKSQRVSEIYGQQVASQDLIRSYIAALCKADLLQRYTLGRLRRVRLTLAGMGVVFDYHRELRAGVKALLAA